MSTSFIESTLNTLIAEMRKMTIDGRDKDIDKLVKDTAKKLSKKLSKNEVESKKVKGKKTAYQIFCVKNRDPTLSFIEANRAISMKWKALSDDEKAEFVASVQSEIDADVERFNDEKSSSEDEKTEKTEKKKKDPNAPKRPLGSFMLFCKEQREENSDLKGVDGTKRISEAWNALSASAKEVYTNKAKVLMDAFKGKPVEMDDGADIPSKMEAADKKSKKVDEESSDETEKAESVKAVKKTKKVDEESSDETEKSAKEKVVKKTKKVDEESSDEKVEKTEKVEKKTKKAKKVAE